MKKHSFRLYVSSFFSLSVLSIVGGCFSFRFRSSYLFSILFLEHEYWKWYRKLFIFWIIISCAQWFYPYPTTTSLIGYKLKRQRIVWKIIAIITLTLRVCSNVISYAASFSHNMFDIWQGFQLKVFRFILTFAWAKGIKAEAKKSP